MPRVKRSVHARKKRRKVLSQAKGYWGLKKSSYRYAKEQVEHSLALRVPRPQEQEADVPAAVDHPHQRGGAAERALVQPVHGGAAQGGDPARPQGARRARGERSAGVRRDRRAGEVRARRPDAARGLRGAGPAVRGPLASLRGPLPGGSRDDPAVAGIVGDEPAWDAPLRLLGGLHYLVLGGEASWDDPLDAHADVPARLRARRRACRRTRCSARGCCCRASSAPPSCSASTSWTSSSSGRAPGLNLVWDRYRYVVRGGRVGAGGIAASVERSRGVAGAGGAAGRCAARDGAASASTSRPST